MAINESNVQAATRLEICRLGGHAWRNNSGCATDQSGRLIRYGLANETPAENKRIKSSDVIACCPLLIEPRHVGTVVGVLGAFEIKHSDWTPPKETNRDAYAHYAAQARFIDLVRGVGGYGGFVTDLPDIWRAMRLPGY